MDIAKTFGLVLRQLRKDTGMTQEQLGLEAGLERNFISMLELGQRQPTLTTIFKVAVALGVKPSEVVALVESSTNDRSCND